MKKYFYTDGVEKYGPFDIDELREMNITRETMVWYDELDEWQSAGSLPELNELFKFTPPTVKMPSNNFNGNYNSQKPPKTWLVESILVTLFCCLPFGIAGIVNASKVESRFHAGDIDAAHKYSASAKKWTLVSLFVGIGVIILYIFIVIAGVASGI